MGSPEDDEGALTAEQVLFMHQHHYPILAAYEKGDIEFLRQLAASDEYKAVFGNMGWDQAFDRYESTWWEDDDEE